MNRHRTKAIFAEWKKKGRSTRNVIKNSRRYRPVQLKIAWMTSAHRLKKPELMGLNMSRAFLHKIPVPINSPLQSNLVKTNSDKTNTYNSLIRTFPGQMVGQAFRLVEKIRFRRTTVKRTFDKTNIFSGPSASKVRITQTFSVHTLKTTAISKKSSNFWIFWRLLILLKFLKQHFFFAFGCFYYFLKPFIFH